MSPTISYAVTASTEEEELPLLLDLLQNIKGERMRLFSNSMRELRPLSL